MPSLSLTQNLKTLKQDLLPWQDRFSEIEPLQAWPRIFEDKCARFSTQAVPLSIGIMGQVKAGKSSFLNALLFKGMPVLPTAATPKTANLTRITYGEQACLEVEYYTPEEWAELEQLAASPADQNRDDIKVARELVAMATQNGLKPAEVLTNTSTQRHEIAQASELVGLLNDFAGENGRWTPLVKMTHITLPHESLRGIEVVDTPGMNDPVQSRTQKTRDYMAKCDVVFFLSRCSQFLDQADMELLSNQLPGKGIKRMILVGGQLDSALLDDGYDRESLSACEDNLKQRLSERAAKELEALAAPLESLYPFRAELLRSLKAPVLASTFAHGFAHWPQKDWGEAMQHAHQELTLMGQETWNGFEFTMADWERIANFNTLQTAYEAARQDKEALLQQQREGLIPETVQQVLEQLAQLHKVVSQRSGSLLKGDIHALQAQQQACQQQIKKITETLSAVIGGEIKQAQDKAEKIIRELEQAKGGYTHLQTRTGTDTDTRSRTVSTSTWYKPWTWGDEKRVYETYTTSYQYISATDAIEHIRTYTQESATRIEQDFKRLINPASLLNRLKKSLIDVLDTRSEGFDPTEFRNTLERPLNRLELPSFTLDLGDTTAGISQHFKGDVRNDSAMEKLRQALHNALMETFTILKQGLEEETESLCARLQKIQMGLEQAFSADLEAEQAQLNAAFENKEAELQSYQELLVLTESKKAIFADLQHKGRTPPSPPLQPAQSPGL